MDNWSKVLLVAQKLYLPLVLLYCNMLEITQTQNTKLIELYIEHDQPQFIRMSNATMFSLVLLLLDYQQFVYMFDTCAEYRDSGIFTENVYREPSKYIYKQSFDEFSRKTNYRLISDMMLSTHVFDTKVTPRVFT